MTRWGGGREPGPTQLYAETNSESEMKCLTESRVFGSDATTFKLSVELLCRFKGESADN